MARIRSVKPEFWDDRKLARRTSRDARLLYIGLWNLADEHARLPGDPQWIKGQLFAFDDDLDAATIDGLLKELEVLGCVLRYEVDEEPYMLLPKLPRHQRLEPAKVASRIPAPRPADFGQLEFGADESARDAHSSARDAYESALLYVAGSMEHVGAGANAGRTKCPTRIPDDFAPTAEMVAWARQKVPDVDGPLETEKFVNYWRAKPGKDALKLDWPATWRNWMLRADPAAPRSRSPSASPHASPHDEHKRRR